MISTTTEPKDDIYGSKRNFERQLARVKDWNTTKKNKDLVNHFFEFCGAEGTGDKRKNRYIQDLRQISEKYVKIDLDKFGVNQKQTIEFMNKIRSNGYKTLTINEFVKSLKRFYKVVFGENEEIPDKYRYIKRLKKVEIGVRSETYKEQPITIEEIKKLVNKATRTRDKVFVSISFEGTLRPAEAIGIKRKDMKEIDGGFQVNVFGKTGFRPIFLFQSAPYIRQLLEEEDKKQEDYLFVTAEGKQIGYRRMSDIFAELMFKAGIKKKNTLYWLRHSGITYKRILGISDAALTNYAGWVPGTNQLKIYSHLTGAECRDEVAVLYGVKKDKEVDKIMQQYCPMCKQPVGFANSFCGKCGHPMKEKTLEKKQKLQELGMQLIGKPNVEDEIRRIIKEELRK